MKIYLTNSTQTRRELILQRLKLYNLPLELETLDNITDSVKLSARTSLLLIDQAEKERRELADIRALEWGKILRIGIDFQLPGEEAVFYEILTKALHSTRYPLLLLASGKSKSGCTKLTTHSRLMRLSREPTKTTLIRVNLQEDPRFRRRVKTPHTLLVWPKKPHPAGIISEYLPAGEIVIDGSRDSAAPSDKKYLAQVLNELSYSAPTLVDAGRISAELVELAVASDAKILLVDHRWKTASETKVLAQKWEVPIIRSHHEIRRILAEDPYA